MTAPNPQPLVKSAQDLRDRSDVWIVTDKDRNSEALLLVRLNIPTIEIFELLPSFPRNRQQNRGFLKIWETN